VWYRFSETKAGINNYTGVTTVQSSGASNIFATITAANAGMPTVAIATANFETFAHTLAARGGRSGLRVHVLPYPLNERERDVVDAVGEAHFTGVLNTMGAVLAAERVAA